MFSLTCGVDAELILNSACFATKPFPKTDENGYLLIRINDVCEIDVIDDSLLNSEGNYVLSPFSLADWYVMKVLEFD